MSSTAYKAALYAGAITCAFLAGNAVNYQVYPDIVVGGVLGSCLLIYMAHGRRG